MKIYTRRYSNVGPVSLPALLVPANMQVCFKIPMPSEGKIVNLVFDQVDEADGGGTPIGVTIELLDSVVPYPVGIADFGTPPLDSVEHYRILSPQVAVAGNTIAFSDDDPGYPYMNTDGDSTKNQRFIYLVVLPATALVDTQWRATITCVTDVG